MMETEMEPEDYAFTPCGRLYGKIGVSQIEGKFLGEFLEMSEALEFVRARMEREKFWPNLWWISDHGNGWQIDIEGNAVRD